MLIKGKILGSNEVLGSSFAQIFIETKDGLKHQISIHQRYLLDIQETHKIGDVISLDIEKWQIITTCN